MAEVGCENCKQEVAFYFNPRSLLAFFALLREKKEPCLPFPDLGLLI